LTNRRGFVAFVFDHLRHNQEATNKQHPIKKGGLGWVSNESQQGKKKQMIRVSREEK